MRNSTQQAVDFLGYEIALIEDEDGNVYVPLKRLCEILGIDHKWQMKTIKTEELIYGMVLPVPGNYGRNRRMFCLPVAKLHEWLGTVSPSIVREEIVHRFMEYRKRRHDPLQKPEPLGQKASQEMIMISREQLDGLLDEAIEIGMKMARRKDLVRRAFEMLLKEMNLIEDFAKESPYVRTNAESYILAARDRYSAWVADLEKGNLCHSET